MSYTIWCTLIWKKKPPMLYRLNENTDSQIISMREHQSSDRDMRFRVGCRIPGIMVSFRNTYILIINEPGRAVKLPCISTKFSGGHFSSGLKCGFWRRRKGSILLWWGWGGLIRSLWHLLFIIMDYHTAVSILT